MCTVGKSLNIIIKKDLRTSVVLTATHVADSGKRRCYFSTVALLSNVGISLRFESTTR